MFTEIRSSWCSRFRECSRQVEAELISKSRNKLHQTWSIDFSRSLYKAGLKIVDPRLREFFIQVEVEVLSDGRNQIQQTWGPLLRPPLYLRSCLCYHVTPFFYSRSKNKHGKTHSLCCSQFIRRRPGECGTLTLFGAHCSSPFFPFL